jgi:HD-like signal output (HDOD) protein
MRVLDEEASVEKLANLIIQDYGMTVKLLRAVNAFQFNHSGVAVVSVTHAIFRMGAKAVGELASTMVMFDHFQHHSPGLRQLLMLSLLSANHAREVAGRIGTLRGEEAYLRGMLRNLGEIVVACYFPDDYAAVLKDMADEHSIERVSCRRILHFEYQDLTKAVLREWHMSSILSVLPEAGTPRDPTDTIVSFAHDLTSAVYRYASVPSDDAVTLLLKKYDSLGLGREDVGTVLEAGVTGTRETFAQASIQLDHLLLKHQMTAALTAPPSVSLVPARSVRSSQPASPEEVARSIVEVHHALESQHLDLNEIILIVLANALDAGGFDRAVLALVAGSPREVGGRLGLGIGSEALIAQFQFPCSVLGGPIGVAVSRGQELMAARSANPPPDEQRLLRKLHAGALVMLPLIVDARVLGSLYLDTVSESEPTKTAVTTARHMRDALLKALLARTPRA